MRSTSPISFHCPEIAVFFDLAVESARGILRGFMQYIRLNAPWNVTFVSKTVNDVDPSSLENWFGDGILAHIPDLETLQVIYSKKCPTVLLAKNINDDIFRIPDLTISPPPIFIRCDNEAIGKMAANYFLEKNFRHFAYVAYSRDVCWCQERRRAFDEILSRRGLSVQHFLSPPEGIDWFLQREKLQQWISQLPKPVAILAANDFRGRQVLEVCHRMNLSVPYEVAVLGVDNDLPMCEMSYPSLSSIAIDWEKAGFWCAESLDCLMKGKTPPERIYGPTQVVSRNSTEFFHISDKLVVQILEIIRIARGENLRVSDIVQQLPVSERSAQDRFKRAVGHSIMEEIKQVRLKNICEWIEQTDLSFQEIAISFGFENANHLGQLFKKELGITMGEYRKRKRGG